MLIMYGKDNKLTYYDKTSISLIVNHLFMSSMFSLLIVTVVMLCHKCILK